MRVSRGGMRLKARAQAFGHPHYQLVTSKVEIFQDDLLTAKQLTIWQHSKLYLSRTTATIKLVNERTLSKNLFLISKYIGSYEQKHKLGLELRTAKK